MRIVSFIAACTTTLVMSGCFSSASRLESIVDREVGKAQFVEKTRLELDKVLGKQDSKLKDSLLDMVREKTQVDFVETIVDGRRARVRVKAIIPKTEDISALLLMANFLPKDKMLNMDVTELMGAISSGTRRPASQMDVHTDIYEFNVDFEKDHNWVVNSEQLQRAYSRKNLVTQRN